MTKIEDDNFSDVIIYSLICKDKSEIISATSGFSAIQEPSM